MANFALERKPAGLRQTLKEYIFARPNLRRFWQRLRKLLTSVVWLDVRVSDWIFETFYGIENKRECIWLDGLTLRGPHGPDATAYGPTSPTCVRRALKSLPIDHSQYDFVDFGSGKGHAVLLAAGFPFQRVIGVEFAKELYEASIENQNRWRQQKKCGSIEFHWADALELEVPPKPCVLFFAHPFGAALLWKVLDKVRASLIANPRDMIIIYFNPVHQAVIVDLFDVEVLSGPKRRYGGFYRVRSTNPASRVI